jgi:hypothetical protein
MHRRALRAASVTTRPRAISSLLSMWRARQSCVRAVAGRCIRRDSFHQWLWSRSNLQFVIRIAHGAQSRSRVHMEPLKFNLKALRCIVRGGIESRATVPWCRVLYYLLLLFFQPFFIEHAKSCSPKLTRTQRTSWWTTSAASWWTAFRVSVLNLRLRDDRRGPVSGVASSTRDHDMLALRDQWPYIIPVPLGSKQREQVSTFINSARPPKQ